MGEACDLPPIERGVIGVRRRSPAPFVAPLIVRKKGGKQRVAAAEQTLAFVLSQPDARGSKHS